MTILSYIAEALVEVFYTDCTFIVRRLDGLDLKFHCNLDSHKVSTKIAIEKEIGLTADDLRNRYFSYVIARIKRFKEYPKLEQRKGHEGSVLLEIFISRNGTVRKVRILRQARYMALTEAAIASIRRALPFQPFHKKIPDEELIVRLEIAFCLN